ncbi:MAG TPA: LEA type 2 family protein [Rhodocyclaceae bacterium]|nr:LEA type 2 family protein [Rhodocyclaceae bacterium]HRQ45460.1 LEA type 2 family protein [Rhodocyclaceae bacterium]
MHNTRRKTLMALAGLIVAGCAGVPAAQFERPGLTLTSFRMLPSDDVARRFLIGLRVINPNRTALEVSGLSFEVAFEDRRFLSGTVRNLARIPPHGESEIEVQASLGVHSDLRLFDELLNEPGRDRLRFDLRAQLDLGTLHTPVTLEESGDLRLTAVDRQ